MDDVTRALTAFRAFGEPRNGYGDNPFTLSCTLDEPAPPAEVDAAWPVVELPVELRQAWSVSRQSRLFEDVEYGQWGLVLLSPTASAAGTAQEQARRPDCYRPDDLVIGEFLGDQELLVLAETDGSRPVLVASPLDGRADWPTAGDDLADFLRRYLAATGEKYWQAGNHAAEYR